MDTKEVKTKAEESAALKTTPAMYDLGVSWQTREEILQAFEEDTIETGEK